MALSKRFVQDGSRRIVGSVTSGYSYASAVVRDENDGIAGRTSERFSTTRDSRGKLISTNAADPGLVIGGKRR